MAMATVMPRAMATGMAMATAVMAMGNIAAGTLMRRKRNQEDLKILFPAFLAGCPGKDKSPVNSKH